MCPMLASPHHLPNLDPRHLLVPQTHPPVDLIMRNDEELAT